MNTTRWPRVVVSLLLAGLSLVLLNVASASAENVWKALGTEVFKKEITTVASEELKLVVPSKGTEIRCAKLTIDNGLLLASGVSAGTLLLSECTTYLNEILSKACKPTEPIIAKVKGTLISHEKKFYDLVVPSEGATFTTLGFSEPCPLPSEVGVTGSVVMECVEAPCEKEQATHVVRAASAALFPSHGLKYMGSTATLAGSATMELSDGDKGKVWGAGLHLSPKGNWKIEGVGIKATSSATALIDKDFTLSWKITKLPPTIEIVCQKLSVEDGLLFVASTGSAKVSFSSCETFGDKKSMPDCKPEEPITSDVTGSLVVHNERTFGLISFGTTLQFLEPCVLTKYSVSGTVGLECADAFCEAEQVTHLVQLASTALFPEDKLTVSSNSASLSGSATLSLIGGNLGRAWSAG